MNSPPRVLAVDDQPTNLALMQAILAPLGYEFIALRSGVECIQRINEIDPDILLLDILMPEVNGYEVARRLRQSEATRHLPIIMITACNEVNERVMAIDAGADDFLTKPVESLELRARVKSLLKVKEYHDHLCNYQHELEAEVARRTAELERALRQVKEVSLDTIYRLARAAEYKDEDTGSHIKRMSHYSAAIARKMGLSEEECDHILYAAPMHDIGKIGIPDSVLLKPGQLNEEEWKTMKQHAIIGAVILEGSPSPIIDLARIIALTHHEKWDGSGYPRGAKGEQIPLVGRIVSLADFFDALTSRRPYKPAFSTRKTLEIILENRGTHFAPNVVDAFIEIIPEIERLKHRFRDAI